MSTELKHTATILESLTPTSRAEMIDSLVSALADGHIKTIDTHNTSSVIFIFQQGKNKYVLKAEHGEASATVREITWYKSALSKSLAPSFIHSHQNQYFSFMLLEYIENAKTLEDISASGDYDSTEILHYLEIAFLRNKKLYTDSQPITATKDAIDIFFLGKYEQRLREAKSIPYLKKLYEASTITLNNKKFHTPSAYIDMIVANKDLYDYLTPNKLGLIHGDLHYGNILIGNGDLYFVDPNGASHMPIEYDYGKLLHSVHGGYGQIMKGAYTLVAYGDNHYTFHSEESENLTLAFTHLQSLLSKKELLQGMYAEALHFATMLPHHASDKRETTALYLRCVEIFNELFIRLGEEAII